MIYKGDYCIPTITDRDNDVTREFFRRLNEARNKKESEEGNEKEGSGDTKEEL